MLIPDRCGFLGAHWTLFYTHTHICLNTLYEDIPTTVCGTTLLLMNHRFRIWCGHVLEAFPGLHDQGMLWHMRSHLHSLTLPFDMLGFPILEAGAAGARGFFMGPRSGVMAWHRDNMCRDSRGTGHHWKSVEAIPRPHHLSICLPSPVYLWTSRAIKGDALGILKQMLASPLAGWAKLWGFSWKPSPHAESLVLGSYCGGCLCPSAVGQCVWVDGNGVSPAKEDG